MLPFPYMGFSLPSGFNIFLTKKKSLSWMVITPSGIEVFNFAVHANHLGNFDKCRFALRRSGWGLGPHFYKLPGDTDVTCEQITSLSSKALDWTCYSVLHTLTAISPFFVF